MIDTYTKVVLTVIALALVALVARPFIEPLRAEAQGPVDVRIVAVKIPLAGAFLSQPVPVECTNCRGN